VERNVESNVVDVINETSKLIILEELFNNAYKSKNHIKFLDKIKDTDNELLNPDEIIELFIDILTSLELN
jgi:hypothetical protein